MNWKGNLKKKLTAVLSAGVLAVTGTVSAVSGMTVTADTPRLAVGQLCKTAAVFAVFL